MSRSWRRAAVLPFLAALPFVGVACSDDDDDDAAPVETTTTAALDETLDILVTNDDGYAAPGIDAVVEALRKEPGVKLTVVAPAENQSGSGDATTEGELAVTDVETASGHPATAVAGKPGDSVLVALDRLGIEPDLVVSGTNQGQNIGPFTKVSGTVGAAKWAVRRGIPALAASTGMADAPDYATSARLVVEWVRWHRDAILAGRRAPSVESLNVPTCTTGALRGLVTGIQLASDFQGRDASRVDCTSTKPKDRLVDDVDAFANGFASITRVPVD